MREKYFLSLRVCSPEVFETFAGRRPGLWVDLCSKG